jgi:hypothetical protein
MVNMFKQALGGISGGGTLEIVTEEGDLSKP